ncbi:hypothetical protein GCM10010429_57610 [Micromonospora olivasterospora]
MFGGPGEERRAGWYVCGVTEPAKDGQPPGGDGGLEALRVLKRRLSDVVYQALRTDSTPPA